MSIAVPLASLLHDVEGDHGEVVERLAVTELSEDEDSRRRGLEELRSRLADEAGLRWQNDDDLFLLAFLRARKFDAERALRLVKGFYSTLSKHTDVFYGRTWKDVRRIVEQNCLHFLPQRNTEGCTVAMFRMNAWDPEVATPEDLTGVGILGLMHALRHRSAQVSGIQIILDYGTFSVKQLLHIKPRHLWLFGEILQNSLPLRMRGLHIVNENRLFYYVWVVLQRFLSKKLKERVHFHGKDMSSLHRFIDPSILPEEYGGGQPPLDSSEWLKKIEASIGFINHALSFGYEEEPGRVCIEK